MDAIILQYFVFVLLFWILIVSEITQSKKLTHEEVKTIYPTPTSSNANPTTPQPPPYPPSVLPQPPPATAYNQPPSTQGAGGTWCVANPTASQTSLKVALDYACGYGGADCSAIQQGGACYNPNTFKDHVSYAFNDYYYNNPIPTSCVFGGAAQLSSTDPSYGSCHYASSTKTNTPTFPMTPPSTTPTTTTTSVNYPSGPPTGYGTVTEQPTGGYGSAQPTGMPNSADIPSFKLAQLPVSAILLLLYLYTHIDTVKDIFFLKPLVPGTN